MTLHAYSQLARYKRWADSGLYEVATDNLHRLDAPDTTILLRLLDHIHVVDQVFRHHLLGTPHGFHAAQSEQLPDLQALGKHTKEINDWYVDYVGKLSPQGFDHLVDFTFTNGSPARMRRGEMILHVCLHGTYHRGNAGILLQKNGIAPNDDRLTDFIEWERAQ